MELSELYIADGSIKGIQSSSGSLVVYFCDWQEKDWLITFQDVLAFQSIGAENKELAEVKIVGEDDLLEQVRCAESEEDLRNMRCAIFNSAWNDTPLLKVIASSSKVEAEENKG